ncbi:hypothetical protein ES703_70113 [subsurface metagenome]
MKKFEYKVGITNGNLLSKRLNKLGEEGWQLVSLTMRPPEDWGMAFIREKDESQEQKPREEKEKSTIKKD